MRLGGVISGGDMVRSKVTVSETGARGQPVRRPDALALMRAQLPALSEAERRVAEWILAQPEQVMHLSMANLAERCGVSDTTVLRCCRSLGYRGYTDLKVSLIQTLASPVEIIHGDVQPADDPATVVEKVFRANMQALQDTLQVLDREALARAVDLLSHARHVLIVGVGTSGPLVHDLYNKLMRLGLPCRCETDSYLQLMAAALLGPGDVVVAISQSGASADPVLTLQEAKKHGASTICITGNARAPLTTYADATLLSVSREIRPEAMASRVAQATLIDALYVILALRNLERAVANEQLLWDAVIPKSL